MKLYETEYTRGGMIYYWDEQDLMMFSNYLSNSLYLCHEEIQKVYHIS